MKTKIGYYTLLDTVLAIRQIFSVERFKPFCSAVEAVDTRLSDEEREAIKTIAPLTKDWLEVMENLIDMTMEGIISPEEVFIRASEDPKYLFGASGEEWMVRLLANIWYNHCFIEMSKYHKKISEKSMEISRMTAGAEPMDYILGLSDRIEKDADGTIRFNIKPEHRVHLDDIEHVIVMPSVFSSRNVVFWQSGRTFLFYIALESKAMTLEEPSDMLLLRTLALNDKTRLKMLKALTESALSVNETAEKMNVNASTASRHFKVFKDVGFVDIQSQEGNSIYYRINQEEIKRAMKSIYNYIFEEDAE